jgi:hypothetical protein
VGRYLHPSITDRDALAVGVAVPQDGSRVKLFRNTRVKETVLLRA